MTDDFCCPMCKEPISKEKLQCTNCNNSFFLDNGYVDFIGLDGFYSGEVSQQEMKLLIQDIDTIGYEKGLGRFLEKNPSLINYLTDVRRVDWICHGLGKNNSRCLDIGSGLGNISEQLSHIFEKVYSLDAVKERIEFQNAIYLKILIIKSYVSRNFSKSIKVFKFRNPIT